jgi:hypothetical protein
MRWHRLGTGLIWFQGCEAGERLKRRAAVARAWQPKFAVGVRRGDCSARD